MSKKDTAPDVPEDKKKDTAPDVSETGVVRVKVRALAERRCREGVCFGPEESEVVADKDTIAILKADPLLKVTEA